MSEKLSKGQLPLGGVGLCVSEENGRFSGGIIITYKQPCDTLLGMAGFKNGISKEGSS